MTQARLCAQCLFFSLHGKVKCDKRFNMIRINKGTGMQGRVGKELSIQIQRSQI